VALDEGFIPVEQKMMKERIKNYSTGRTVWLEGKGSNAAEIYNFMHLIMCSNDETNFMQIDEGENRFAVLKVPTLPFDDPQILQKMEAEVPAFLHYLSNRQLHYEENKSRFSFDTKVYETEALKVIQERTQSFLPKQVKDYIRELFMISGQTYLYLSARDIERGLSEYSQTKLKKTEIMYYLKYDLHMKPENRCRYTGYKESLNPDDVSGYTTFSVTGFPYKFFFEDYLTDEDILARGDTAVEAEGIKAPGPAQTSLSYTAPNEIPIKHNGVEYPF
jgi:hypothetical protein